MAPKFVIINGMVRSFNDAIEFLKSLNGEVAPIDATVPEPVQTAPKRTHTPYRPKYNIVVLRNGMVMTREDYLDMRRGLA